MPSPTTSPITNKDPVVDPNVVALDWVLGNDDAPVRDDAKKPNERNDDAE